MRVRPFEREDLIEAAAIKIKAFEHDEFEAWLYPRLRQYPEDLRRSTIIRLRARLVGAGELGFVAETEEGDKDWNGKPQVTGFAYMGRCGDDEGAKQWRADSWFRKLERKLLSWELWYDMKTADRVTDQTRLKKYRESAQWEYFEHLDPRWHLNLIAVSPEFQRRGIGDMLVEHCQQIVAGEGLPFTLESSVVARKLYLNRGFKVVHTVVIETGLPADVLMVWEPLKGKWLEDTVPGEAKLKAPGNDG